MSGFYRPRVDNRPDWMFLCQHCWKIWEISKNMREETLDKWYDMLHARRGDLNIITCTRCQEHVDNMKF